MAAKKPRRYQFLGWILEKGIAGWYVLDWDYEGHESTMYGPATESKCQEYAARRS